MREFGFELALCAALEREGHLVSRQLGGGVRGRRVLDTVLVHPSDEFERRAAITPERIPAAAIEADVGPGRARYWKDAFDSHAEWTEEAVELAVERGFFERERRGGRTYVRQTARYPDWVAGVTAIENKPDLDRPGDLRTQLRTDVSLALVDRVVLATADYVTRAHLNRIPEEVGVWRFDPETGDREVVREATDLPVDEAGVELVERKPLRADVRVVSAAEKARARRRLAERAYGKGWRSFDYPPCANCSPDADGLPHCTWKGRPVRASEECGPDCEGHAEADAPTVDGEALRAERTPWDPDPDGRRRRQSGLDRFG
ncbi:DUF5787 family protein [Haloarcula nitratireducens]|uniref:Uncharacterized protein n=1 Tax=Haloarcula nitratireducens TaxID=2487749 RepID=A0AAW4PDZ3_9EURY|nr:DUF5787 family protein [Halomicroarcula nitratireducens]MBX0295813.1 hypothetical protein [Halomicroarcula nitratireducens]